MLDFMIRFFICNLFVIMIIAILSAIKWIFRNHLSGRMQYHLWFILLGLLAVPFLPVRPIGFLRIFSWFSRKAASANTKGISNEMNIRIPSESADFINDFALSVSRETPSIIGLFLFGVWLVGILAMSLLFVRSKKRLNTLEKSALSLQNQEIRNLYRNCLEEMNITKDIPIYSTAFLKSPVIVGLVRPRIYLPLHLVSDYNTFEYNFFKYNVIKYNAASMPHKSQNGLRYMLLHELQHYKHKDALANYVMNITGILYWFNPFVWYALKEMRNDREVACDTSVLEMLSENDYEDYGNTLINFIEKVSLTPFPFTAGISSNMKQMKRRILNIATYKKPSLRKRIRSTAIFLLTSVLLFSTAPALSTYAVDGERYYPDFSTENVSYVELSDYFGSYEGSFVLYDLEQDSWKIHNPELSTLRVSPNSTYKIYTALFGLEENIITPENSFISWNHEIYPFDAWNTDQNLQSAMESSVNWYFQTINEQIGSDTMSSYIRQIGYGNENISGDSSAYWMESSLKISAVEQVELLTKLYNNSFGFEPDHIDAVKDSICLKVSPSNTLYGKTGTGRVDGQDINGWFVGFVESSGHTYFFAVNIMADNNATGSSASEIALSILTDMKIWNERTVNK